MRMTIVIPTKDRATFLPQAIRAALAQEHGDVEVLISDNASVDETARVIDSFAGDPRIKRVRPDRPLSMVDHWNFALAKALELTRGEFFIVSCDDDALTSDATTILDRYARAFPDTKLFQYSLETYYYDDDTNAAGNTLKFRDPRPRGGYRVDGRRYIAHVFATLTSHMPRLLNSAVHRSILEEMTRRWGRVVHPWAPDFSSGVLMMHLAGHFVDIREPLMIWGKGAVSYGSGSQANPDHLLEFMRQFPEFTGKLELAQYPELITVGNMVADTLLLTRRLLGSEGEWMRINPWTLSRMIEKDIKIYQSRGHDRYDRFLPMIRADKRAARFGPKLALQMSKMPRRIERFTRLFSPSNVANLLHGARGKTVRIDGKDAGFSDIAGAAAYYSRHVRR